MHKKISYINSSKRNFIKNLGLTLTPLILNPFFNTLKADNLKDSIKKFEIKVSKEKIDKIISKVRDFDWTKMKFSSGWEMGTDPVFMRDLCNYWIEQYSWKKNENELNSFSHYKTKVSNIDIHFIHEKGSGPNAIPLILSHGWPGSIAEFKKIIRPLTHPQNYGGSQNDSFDVIVPSLPGFGFSSAPSKPYGPRKIAEIFNKLMVNNLGYKKYIAQGGDWGGYISAWMGFDHSKFCQGVHINYMGFRHKDPPKTEEEIKWLDDLIAGVAMEKGYMTQKATKPLSLAYSMSDSSVGVAAWIIEKFYGWSDRSEKSFLEVFSQDELLTNIMIYLITDTFETASWIYYGRREEGGRVLSKIGKRVEVPTACAVFPKELLPWPPKSYADRLFNIVQWTNMPSGGHFAAMEEPQLLTKDITKFSKRFR